jgi:deoxyribodipyrimidine photolyase-related protein
MKFHPRKNPRHLVLVLGDQLDPASAAFDGFDPAQDAVWMVEVAEESTHVWSHQARIVLFLSAMRHFRSTLEGRGVTVHYRELDERGNRGTFAGELAASVERLRPQRLIVVEPGEWRVANALAEVARPAGLPLDVRIDRHFFCTRDEFAKHAKGRKLLRMEFFYREMRQRTGFLMSGGKPVGEAWNYDAENRKSFGRDGPGLLPKPRSFPPDATTREVIELVRRRFPKHPGNLDTFDWAVTPEDAERALADFIENRLPLFGDYEDAMWTREPVLYHSRLSSAMNLKLLDPRRVLAAAVKALEQKRAPLPAVEGFVRQILGWREYVRGVYWLLMPEYLERNHLDAHAPLPAFYWTADTEMNCLRQVMGQTLELGFAHHIQRLMVAGLFSLLLGVRPQAVHEWYLAIYVDAVEWVELPNVLGMSQFGDGEVMGSKPYVATGKYIDRMSDYCAGCAYDPALRTGPKACPFTTLYWDFLDRHRRRLAKNHRMTMQLKNLDRLKAQDLAEVRKQAGEIKARYAGEKASKS